MYLFEIMYIFNVMITILQQIELTIISSFTLDFNYRKKILACFPNASLDEIRKIYHATQIKIRRYKNYNYI
jgi:hypothetical protein